MLRALLIATLAVSASAWGKKKGQAPAEMDEAEHLAHEEYKATGRSMGARDFEMDNMRKHKAGELNAAELGMENMKAAMNDPGAMAEMAQMMRDPEAMKQVREMMANPGFQKQAQAVKEQMAAGGAGGMPDISKLMQDPAVMQKARAMAQAMGVGVPGEGGGGGGSMEAEIARLRAENAALKQQAAI